MRMFPKTCIVIFLLLVIGKVDAGAIYHIDDRYYEVLGTTSDQGMNDAIAALRLGNINLIPNFGIYASIPVWTRNHEGATHYEIMPHFFTCFPFPVIEIAGQYMTTKIPMTERYYPLQHALDSYESVNHVPDDTFLYKLCTYDYARGYNTLILNYLILHPEELDKIRQTPEMIKERRLRNAQDMVEALKEDTKFLEEMGKTPFNCPDDTDSSQDKLNLEVIDIEQLIEIDIEPYNMIEEHGEVIPVDPNLPPGERCDIPLVLDDIDLLPMTDFLKENKLGKFGAQEQD